MSTPCPWISSAAGRLLPARRELLQRSTYLDQLAAGDTNAYAAYGGESLHERSHGEAFLALLEHRFGGDAFYALDEPEAALSPLRQLTLLAVMDDLVAKGCQFVVATHSPMIMAYPGATIYLLSQDGIREIAYEETEHFSLTRDFLNHRERYFSELPSRTGPNRT